MSPGAPDNYSYPDLLILRERSNHIVYVNPRNNRKAPGHGEISGFTARAVCEQLKIPRP